MLLYLIDGPQSRHVNPARLCKVFLEWRGSFRTVTWQEWKSEKNDKFRKYLNMVAPSQVKEKKAKLVYKYKKKV